MSGNIFLPDRTTKVEIMLRLDNCSGDLTLADAFEIARGGGNENTLHPAEAPGNDLLSLYPAIA